MLDDVPDEIDPDDLLGQHFKKKHMSKEERMEHMKVCVCCITSYTGWS